MSFYHEGNRVERRVRSYYTLVWGGGNSKTVEPNKVPDDSDQDDGLPSSVCSSDADGRGPMAGEEELATKMLQIQSKRFYLDVKQNRRGRFLKIAEVGTGGRKSRLLMSMPVAAEFREYLTEFSDLYASLGPPNSERLSEDGRIKSEVISRDNRRYYLDLKENSRGRFLRISQSILRGPRSIVVIPAQGLVEFRDTLTKLLEEYGVDEAEDASGPLPESKQFRVDNKIFYFDIGQNNRGVFMRVSEVKNNFRTAITIPERSWSRFRDIFAEVCDRMDKLTGDGEERDSTEGLSPNGEINGGNEGEDEEEED